jgi:serine/threonine protein kinase
MCEALDNIHKNGVCHRDLKPENILLDTEFNIKIADFGFAAPTDGKEHTGFLRTRLGTLNYMAPEIHQRKPYSGPAADVFAASIILFIMLTQHPPFNTAQPDDGFYKCIAANRSDLFWKSHAKTKQENFFSEDFKKLIQSMMQLDPSNRPNFLEVLNHPWMKGPTATKEQVQHEFAQRKQTVDNALFMEKQAQMQQKMQ